ncbi:MAG: acyltransferase [Bacteroidia bacterium]|jgi:acetyltransferase-like isoleucine patch superfamily enzyme|nr:acyltransferase [Bacteroidia bacterium]
MLNSKQYDYSLLNSIGKDVFISANVEIRRPHLVNIGNHVAIDSGFYLTTAAQIGDYIHIAPYITVIGGATSVLTMEHFSAAAAGTRIICASDGYLGEGLMGPTIPDEFRDDIFYGNVTFKKFATVGTNVVIMPGVTLAEGSIVGACSLVTKDTEPWTIYTGIPAKPVKARKKEKMIEYAKQLGY